MATQGLLEEGYHHTFHGHETFPLRYGWLQKAYNAVSTSDSSSAALKLFSDPASIARFGLGRNMVKSLRYWSIHSGILELKDKGLTTTAFGRGLIGPSGTDPYLETADALWMIHWHLCSRSTLTSWFWLFNHFNGSTFTRKQLVDAMLLLARRQGWTRISETTIDRDFQCLLRAYVGGRGNNENGDSILSELGLIQPLGGRRFRMPPARRDSLSLSVFIYALVEFWSSHDPSGSTLSYAALAYGPGSPGRVFALDDAGLMEKLDALENATDGALAWSETAGLEQVIARGDLVPANWRKRALESLRSDRLRAA